MFTDRSALMIIRVWAEEGSTEPLRASIRLTTDTSIGFRRTLNLTQIDAITAAVDAWLRELQAN